MSAIVAECKIASGLKCRRAWDVDYFFFFLLDTSTSDNDHTSGEVTSQKLVKASLLMLLRKEMTVQLSNGEAKVQKNAGNLKREAKQTGHF